MYVLHCPHCDALIESTNHPVSYGNPIKICPKCRRQYIDPNCTEPALRPYKPLSVTHRLKASLSGGFAFAGFVAILVYFITKDNRLGLTIWGIGTPLCWLFSFLLSLHTQKKREKGRYQRWQESNQRLRNPKYAYSLKYYGYHVPAQYLPADFPHDPAALTYLGATVESYTSRKEKNPKPHMPDGSEFY